MKQSCIEGLLCAIIIALALCLIADDLLRIRVLHPGTTCPVCHQIVEDSP